MISHHCFVGSVTTVFHHAVVENGGGKFVGNKVNESRRDFLKKSAYVVPVVLTLKAAPTLASTGSPKKPRDDKDGGTHHYVNRRNKRNKHMNFFQAFRDAFSKFFS